jgi:hypothetical protein
MMGAGAGGALRAGRAQDAPEGASPQGSSTMAAGGDEVPAPDTTMMAEAMASLATSGAAAGDPTASTSLVAGPPPTPPRMVTATTSTGADDNAVEEPVVIMGHPGLRASGTVTLSEEMGTSHFALNQAHDVLRQEREDINKERLHLLVWVSLLKQQMTSEKEKVEVRQKNLDVMEVLYSRRQVVVDKLDAQTEKLLDNAKELYAVAEARTNATIKQQEDLNAQAVATAKREQAVAEQELKLWEKEEQGDLSLERELEALTSREATIAVE